MVKICLPCPRIQNWAFVCPHFPNRAVHCKHAQHSRLRVKHGHQPWQRKRMFPFIWLQTMAQMVKHSRCWSERTSPRESCWTSSYWGTQVLSAHAAGDTPLFRKVRRSWMGAGEVRWARFSNLRARGWEILPWWLFLVFVLAHNGWNKERSTTVLITTTKMMTTCGHISMDRSFSLRFLSVVLSPRPHFWQNSCILRSL